MGASGSSAIIARLFVSSGILFMLRGGLIFFPSQVYFLGILLLLLKAELVIIRFSILKSEFI
jgi:hypothetical protein